MFTKPRKASTVMMLQKNQGDDFRVLMLLRHRDNPFVPGNYVFPGGALDENDYAPEWSSCCSEISSFDSLEGNTSFSSKEEALPYFVAAVRETFEETGILMAERKNGESLMHKPPQEAFTEKNRKRVYNGDVSFLDFIRDEDLILSTSELIYHSRWITPRVFPIRYDAHFFVTLVPEDVTVKHDGYELVEHEWITPENALEKYRAGKMKMVLPTVESLRSVSGLSSIDSVFLDQDSIF